MLSKIKFTFLALVLSSLFLAGCGNNDRSATCGASNVSDVALLQAAGCSGAPITSLPNYDRLSAQFLDEATRHPAHNLGGNVVWGTRYYLESLLTAYEATGNQKYIEAFLDSGEWVLNLSQTMNIIDIPDPGEPVAPGDAKLMAVTGWPTRLGSFSVPTSVPTQTGKTALYAQSFGSAVYFQVLQDKDGGLDLNWTDPQNHVLQTRAIHTVSDLNVLGEEVLVWGKSVGRIKPTGTGLPAPGTYPVYALENTIWNSEQAGGILLPFAHFLLLAKQQPGVVDDETQKRWLNKILNIASSYEEVFVSDGSGGLRQHNPAWLPNAVADMDAPMDYISVEATLRMFLYELTGDVHQLSLADGLLLHQQNFRWMIGPQGWFLLQLWPDLQPWSSRTDAPQGSVWDVFQSDPATPSPVTDGGFFAELLHYSKFFNLAPSCLNDAVYNAHRSVFEQYLMYQTNPTSPTSLLRGAYPTPTSTPSDPINPSADPFAGSGYLTPEVADQAIVDANWRWMQNFGEDPQGQAIGYFLRAWARSESAEARLCQYRKKRSR